MYSRYIRIPEFRAHIGGPWLPGLGLLTPQVHKTNLTFGSALALAFALGEALAAAIALGEAFAAAFGRALGAARSACRIYRNTGTLGIGESQRSDRIGWPAGKHEKRS